MKTTPEQKLINTLTALRDDCITVNNQAMAYQIAAEGTLLPVAQALTGIRSLATQTATRIEAAINTYMKETSD